jgi:hypothetical protein
MECRPSNPFIVSDCSRYSGTVRPGPCITITTSEVGYWHQVSFSASNGLAYTQLPPRKPKNITDDQRVRVFVTFMTGRSPNNPAEHHDITHRNNTQEVCASSPMICNKDLDQQRLCHFTTPNLKISMTPIPHLSKSWSENSSTEAPDALCVQATCQTARSSTVFYKQAVITSPDACKVLVTTVSLQTNYAKSHRQQVSSRGVQWHRSWGKSHAKACSLTKRSADDLLGLCETVVLLKKVYRTPDWHILGHLECDISIGTVTASSEAYEVRRRE